MPVNWDEYSRVEKRALNLFDKLGYKVYDKQETDIRPARNNLHEVILLDKLRAALKKINP